MSGPASEPVLPALVRGVSVVVGSDGEAHLAERPVVALCRCDRSQRAPWCDNTHKLLGAAPRRSGTERP